MSHRRSHKKNQKMFWNEWKNITYRSLWVPAKFLAPPRHHLLSGWQVREARCPWADPKSSFPPFTPHTPPEVTLCRAVSCTSGPRDLVLSPPVLPPRLLGPSQVLAKHLTKQPYRHADKEKQEKKTYLLETFQVCPLSEWDLCTNQ